MPAPAAAPIIATLMVAAVSAQPAGKVEFGRDVQPILREHCISCHGPTQQMSGLRLDRRADALRGGSQSDIGPGNAEGSRLYQRLVGTAFGLQMPPAGPLSDTHIGTLKQWIDEGAEWPDELSGEAPTPPADPDAVRLIQSIRDGDRAAIDRRLHQAPRAATARGERGTTPLMSAALYGDATLVKRLLDAGADPNAANTAGAAALMWAVPDADAMRLLLDAGADPNARSEDRRSPLVVASGVVGAAPAVKLLLDYGADPSVWSPTETPPLREAARVDDAESFRTLLEYGAEPDGAKGVSSTYLRTNCAKCAQMLGRGAPLPRVPPPAIVSVAAGLYDPARAARPTPVGPVPASPASVRAAVERSLPLLQQIDADFVRSTGCVSCHHNSAVAMAVTSARAGGYAVDEPIAKQQLTAVGNYLESWRERTIQNFFIAGQADTISYLMFGQAMAGATPDEATDAQAIWLLRRQAADGRWPVTTLRPPIESSDIAVTALALRALQAFAPRSRRAESDAAVERARTWLVGASGADTEDRAFRLLGLHWSGASRAITATAARDLRALQQEDGGWAQTATMTSDAYATGEALVALREAGAVSAGDPAYRKGIEFLLSTQLEDGSWFVETRAVPIQAYFDSGFPYGLNQWISAAATAWATTALAKWK